MGDSLREIDWQLFAFVGGSLLIDFLVSHLPEIQYWNGERTSHKSNHKP
jgi:hypothetical protein